MSNDDLAEDACIEIEEQRVGLILAFGTLTGKVMHVDAQGAVCLLTKVSRLRAEVDHERKSHGAYARLCEETENRLEAAIERLTLERDEARSKETDYNEGFEEGWDAAHEGAAAVVERLRAALIEWDALIQHQYSGSREAMSDMQAAALNTKKILDELDALDGLETKP